MVCDGRLTSAASGEMCSLSSGGRIWGGAKGITFLLNVLYYLQSIGCDADGLNTEVGAKNRVGGSTLLKPLTLTTANIIFQFADDATILIQGHMMK